VTGPRLGRARVGRFRSHGSALCSASRTIRRWTPSVRATPLIVPIPHSYSRLICATIHSDINNTA
jgi:hypothetical protein